MDSNGSEVKKSYTKFSILGIMIVVCVGVWLLNGVVYAYKSLTNAGTNYDMEKICSKMDDKPFKFIAQYTVDGEWEWTAILCEYGGVMKHDPNGISLYRRDKNE